MTTTDTITNQQLHDLIVAKTGSNETAETLLLVIRHAVREYHNITGQLTQALTCVHHDAVRALDDVANSRSVNSLGIFHQSAADANRYAALRQHQAEAIRMNLYLVESLTGTSVSFAAALTLNEW